MAYTSGLRFANAVNFIDRCVYISGLPFANAVFFIDRCVYVYVCVPILFYNSIT